jgi:hypothetical protein
MPNTIVGYLNGGTVIPVDSLIIGIGRTPGDSLDQSSDKAGIGILTSGYKGMPWFRSAFCTAAAFWPPEAATPNAGQLYPLAGATGGPGQVMPY